MSILKKIFPLSFLTREKETNALVISILLHVAIIVAYFLASGLLGYLCGPGVAWLLGFVGILVGMYATGGMVLAVLLYCGIIK